MNEKRDQDTVAKLLPPWRQFCLSTHGYLTKVVAWLTFPFTWLVEQVDGTADWRAMDARLDAESRKRALKAVSA